MSPFDFLNAINQTKEELIVDDITEKQYNAFIVNRGLSYFYDTVLLANEMNFNHHISNKTQFDFYINSVRKKKRFSKWNKTKEDQKIKAIKEYFNYSNEKAKDAIKLLSDNQIDEIIKKVNKGGK